MPVFTLTAAATATPPDSVVSRYSASCQPCRRACCRPNLRPPASSPAPSALSSCRPPGGVACAVTFWSTLWPEPAPPPGAGAVPSSLAFSPPLRWRWRSCCSAPELDFAFTSTPFAAVMSRSTSAVDGVGRDCQADRRTDGNAAASVWPMAVVVALALWSALLL